MSDGKIEYKGIQDITDGSQELPGTLTLVGCLVRIEDSSNSVDIYNVLSFKWRHVILKQNTWNSRNVNPRLSLLKVRVKHIKQLK